MISLLALSLSLPALAAGPVASSTLDGADGKLHPTFAFDGLLQTGWAEGAPGYGEESWIELDTGRSTELFSLSIWPGNLAQGAKSYREYTRPKLVTVMVDGEPAGEPIRLVDKMQRLDVPLEGTGRRVRLQVDEVFEGIVYSDLYIAEMAINFVEGGGKDKSDAWWEGRTATSLLEEHEAEVEEAYFAYKEAEFGDRDALAQLMNTAADGPVAARSLIPRYAAYGFRAQAMRPSVKAQSALRKLRDANAIPALELAALRATGSDQKELLEDVEIFKAIQDLESGGNRNLPYWGATGWEPGALRSFEEPLALEIDVLGQVLVADTGNSRVVRFNENGRPAKVWGSPEADISNAWFSTGRPWYVSGSKPGDGVGQFQNPIDIELIPGKESDAFAVLDATGRVRIFDEEGRPQISWTVEVRSVAEAGLGGEGYLAWVPKKGVLVAIIGDDVVGYSLDSEERFRWELEDGTPNAVEVMPNGKLLCAYHDEIIQYSLVGFRFGTVINTEVLKGGFEDLDLTVDEKGKLWLFTDTGWVYKFKKPGKVDLQVMVTDEPVRRPRIAVQEGLMFYTSYDSVKQIDVLQIILDQEQQADLEASQPVDEW